MARHLLSVLGFSAAVLNLTAIVEFVRWGSKTDWFFSHYQGPPDQIFTAVAAGVAGMFATATWFFVARRRKLDRSQSTSSQLERPRLNWLHAVPLMVLALPTGIVLLIGIPSLPQAWKMAALQPLDLRTASVPQLIKALKSGDEEQRMRAAMSVVASVTGESDDGLTGLPPLTESSGKRVNVMADRRHLPELVDALASALTNPQLVGLYAAEALGAIGPDAKFAVPALVAAVRRTLSSSVSGLEKPSLGDSATQALTKIGPVGIAGLLNDKSTAVRRHAAGALGVIGPQAKTATAALMRALRDNDDEVRNLARNALQRIDPNRND